MLLVAASPAYDEAHPADNAIVAKMIGVAFASAASGGGEVTFLSLTHFYGPFSLAGWGSGTGAAGLVGAGAYALATTGLGLGSRVTLFASAFLPFALMGSFFLLLPMGPLKRTPENKRSRMTDPHDPPASEESATLISNDDDDNDNGDLEALSENEQASLPRPAPESPLPTSPYPQSKSRSIFATFTQTLHRLRPLLLPYMLPLFLVYTAEYLINTALLPTLLFPLPSTPFRTYRAFYPAYSTIYQAGVFVSRSSTPFLRLHNLYLPSLLQCLNVILFLAQALWPWGESGWMGSVWVVFAVVFWEGLLGGGVYVNTFAEIGEGVPPEGREFALGAVSVADSAGIVLAGVVGVGVEVEVCRWQVERLGRDWCRRL